MENNFDNLENNINDNITNNQKNILNEEQKRVARKKSSMAISALTLGIIAMCTLAFWYISIPTSILAIVFGAKTTRRIGSKLGKAGLILGIIGLSLTILLYAVATTLILLNGYI
ncbi:MAG: DUF4190 domain-containing protein [Bacilli bacterium]|nr:DUF4190 domain-containing protein [Bacilli bacterium]